jgi:hypothetical protein
MPEDQLIKAEELTGWALKNSEKSFIFSPFALRKFGLLGQLYLV